MTRGVFGMNIMIEYCNNLKRLEMDIEEKKINILLAPSGAGKSTIKEALSPIRIQKLQSVYCSHNPNAEINGKFVEESPFDFAMFDEEFKKKVLIEEEESNNNVYNIFIGDDTSYQGYLKKYNDFFMDIIKLREELDIYIDSVKKIEKEVLKLKNNKEIHNSSKLIKFENKKNELDKKQKLFLNNYTSEYYSWLKEGVNYSEPITIGKCPFCGRKMSEAMNKKIETIKSIPVNDFKILESASPLLVDINVKVPNFFNNKQVRELKKDVIRKIEVKDEVEKIISFIDEYSDITNKNLEKPKLLKMSKAVYTEFPQLEPIIENINKALKSVFQQYWNCKSKLQSEIKKNEKTLNKYLDILGIPYEFALDQYERGLKTARYKLFHKSDSLKNHRVFGLSYGEKNIISLLLFIIKTNTNYIIIDDPASSFDEYKRSSIYNMMMDLLKNKTVLLLSHDCVFGKLFALDQKNSAVRNKLGRLLFMENYDYCQDAEIKPVVFEDFGTLEFHILNYIENNKKVDYWAKIVLLRILLEPYKRKKAYEIPYSYLSAVLHRESKIKIENELLMKGITEREVLDDIANLLAKETISDFILEEYDDKMVPKDSLNPFIKLMLKRESITNREMKKELSSIIHLNEAQLIQLNPFKFNCFSKKVYDLIN